MIENNKKYTTELKDKIDKILKDIKDNKSINLDIIK
jgi:hypothetical protein